MAEYKTEPSETGYAPATTPLPDLGNAEPSVTIKIHAEPLGAAGPPRSAVAIQRGKWDAELCGCFDACVPNCCMATFCPCISAAQIGSRVGYKYSTVLFWYAVLVIADLVFYVLEATNTNSNDRYYYYYSDAKSKKWGYLGGGVSVILFLAYWQLRSKVRSTFDVPGNCLDDCCTTFWCSCCSLAQMATHVKSYKPGSCDFGPPDELAAYDE